MSERTPELLGILREEIRYYQELLECEERKTTLLTEGRVEDLEECNKTEENNAIRIQNLEAKRKHLCQILCGELGIPQEELTPARLAESLDDPHEFNEVTALLRDVVQRVQVVGARNCDLIKKPLHYTEGLLTIFSNAAGPYQPDGTFNTEASILPTFSKDA